MTIGRAVFIVAALSVAGCSTTPLTACGPAMPPIATAAHEPPPPGFSPPPTTAAADAPAPVPKPAVRTPHPLDNVAAVAGR